MKTKSTPSRAKLPKGYPKRFENACHTLLGLLKLQTLSRLEMRFLRRTGPRIVQLAIRADLYLDSNGTRHYEGKLLNRQAHKLREVSTKVLTVGGISEKRQDALMRIVEGANPDVLKCFPPNNKKEEIYHLLSTYRVGALDECIRLAESLGTPKTRKFLAEARRYAEKLASQRAA